MKAEMLGDVRRYDPPPPSPPVPWAWDATQSKVATSPPPPISQSQQIFVLIYSSIDKLGLFRFFTIFVSIVQEKTRENYY